MELPLVRDVLTRLRREGFVLTGCVGDHRKFVRACRVVIVPGRLGSHLKPGTWASIRRQAGWR